jgi:hypothetical protein
MLRVCQEIGGGPTHATGYARAPGLAVHHRFRGAACVELCNSRAEEVLQECPTGR